MDSTILEIPSWDIFLYHLLRDRSVDRMTAEQVGCESIRRQCVITHQSWLKDFWRLGAKSEYTRVQHYNPIMVIFAKGALKVIHSISY